MATANELFMKASDLQFKAGEPEQAYALYQQILRDYPKFDKMSIVRQLIAGLERDGLDLSLVPASALSEEQRKKMEAVQKKEVELSGILISSGFSFDGYRIVKYSGYISGDDAVQIPRTGLFEKGMNGQNLTDALVKIRRQALAELKEAAYNLGCNAVIGVDFDYITLEPQTAMLNGATKYEPYVVCVTANGNAVIIEKC